jgi:hypothetical protein
VRVHLAGEHAAELERLDLPRDALHLTDDVVQRALVGFFTRELGELRGFVERPVDAAECRDDGFELCALAS